jgi:hypothetical protein
MRSKGVYKMKYDPVVTQYCARERKELHLENPP